MIGVVVGRFQVDELTQGHQALIESALRDCNKCLVVIGVAHTLLSKQDPLSYELREQMIKTAYEFRPVSIVHLKDCQSNVEWSLNLERIIAERYPLESATLYLGRDHGCDGYVGKLPVIHIEAIDTESGSDRRNSLIHVGTESTNFRRGVIHASQNQYPRVWPCVDIAVVRGLVGKQVLMGHRSYDSLLRFPGGFVDPSDINMESAARRELHEEIDIRCTDDMKYLGSQIINDWRYPTEDSKVMTSLFMTGMVGTEYGIKEEFYSLEWINVDNSLLANIAPNHIGLFKMLITEVNK